MNGEYGTKVLLGTFVFPVGNPLYCLILTIGLGNAEFKVTGHDGIDVEHGPSGRFDRSANAVFFALFVDHLGDRASGGVINPGNAAGADSDKLCLSLGTSGRRSREKYYSKQYSQSDNK